MEEHSTVDVREGVSAAADRADRAFAEVYEELRRLARFRLQTEPAGHTLQTTALVHEVFLKLRGSAVAEDRGQFLRLAGEAMRQILVDHARGKRRAKRGGGARREELTDVAVLAADPDAETVLALESAVCRLEVASPRAAEVIKLRFYAGLSIEETAETVGASVSTVNRQWRFARAWLYRAIGDTSGGSGDGDGPIPEGDTDGPAPDVDRPGGRA